VHGLNAARTAASKVASSWGEFFWVPTSAKTTSSDATKTSDNNNSPPQAAVDFFDSSSVSGGSGDGGSGDGGAFRPLALGSDGQPSEAIHLTPDLVQWVSDAPAVAGSSEQQNQQQQMKQQKRQGRRVAVLPVWVKPCKVGRVCCAIRVSYRPRADHPHVVGEVLAFEVGSDFVDASSLAHTNTIHHSHTSPNITPNTSHTKHHTTHPTGSVR
jgi:hypothetical protein